MGARKPPKLASGMNCDKTPKDYQACISPILKGECLVVYGSRRLNKENKQYSGISFFIGGWLLTMFINFLCFSKLTDEPTCYKTFHKSIISRFKIESDNFDWEPEITVKILKKGIEIVEVPISYYPRKKNEGKHINWKDFVSAVYASIKSRFKN